MSCPHPVVAGEPTQTCTALLETATAAIQGFGPINQIHQHLCAFHYYGDDMTRQVEAHHFCAHQNEEMRQCLIYDSPAADARLIGVEYLVSENLFMTLPDEEKPLWHSHEYEVKSGILFMPGIPGPIQRKDLEKVAKTYGKTYHFWQVDRGDALPLGLPQLMMSFTEDGQMKGPDHGIHPKANGGGKGLKTVLRETDCGPAPGPHVHNTTVPRVFV